MEGLIERLLFRCYEQTEVFFFLKKLSLVSVEGLGNSVSTHFSALVSRKRNYLILKSFFQLEKASFGPHKRGVEMESSWFCILLCRAAVPAEVNIWLLTKENRWDSETPWEDAAFTSFLVKPPVVLWISEWETTNYLFFSSLVCYEQPPTVTRSLWSQSDILTLLSALW